MRCINGEEVSSIATYSGYARNDFRAPDLHRTKFTHCAHYQPRRRSEHANTKYALLLEKGDHVYARSDLSENHGIVAEDGKSILHNVADRKMYKYNNTDRETIIDECPIFHGDRKCGIIKTCIPCFTGGRNLYKYGYGNRSYSVWTCDGGIVAREISNSYLGTKFALPGDIKPGVHVYVYRDILLYTHHGVIARDGCSVIHFVDDRSLYKDHDGICPRYSGAGKYGIIKTCIPCFTKSGYLLHLYRYDERTRILLSGTTTTCKRDSFSTITERAHEWLERGDFGTFDLSLNNCENFALFCSTGKRIKSQQIARLGPLAAFMPLAGKVRVLRRKSSTS
ncbi:hypothetical protein Mapa_005125 [Marchantia paleacea]|nr:hypothetical protein Mapa_005125 [Marchantia paleacea]